MVTYEAVAKAIEDLESEKIKPTVSNVRTKIGGGSNNKILSIMNEYFKNRRPELPPITSEWSAKIMKVLDEFSADRSNRAVLVYRNQLELAEANQIQMIESDKKWEETTGALNQEIELLRNTVAELNAKVLLLTDNLDTAKAEIEKANQRAQNARDELITLQIRKGDFEATQAELVKVKDEAMQAMQKAAHLTGLLEGRSENKTGNTEIDPEKSQPDAKQSRTSAKKLAKQ
jgi:chromosome segregation ATPase